MKGNQKSTGSLNPSLVAVFPAIGKYGVLEKNHNSPCFYKLHQPTKTPVEESTLVKTPHYLFSKDRSDVDRPGKTNTRDLVNQQIPEALLAKNPATGLYCTVPSVRMKSNTPRIGVTVASVLVTIKRSRPSK